MLRVIMWLLGLVIAITFLRGVIGIFGKAIGDQMGRSRVPRPPRPENLGGPLRQCAECGEFATVYATSQRGGTERHYCSPACQERADVARR
jgi:hypothetical protein